jgi:DNA-binding transcriptional ArsR family regulator
MNEPTLVVGDRSSSRLQDRGGAQRSAKQGRPLRARPQVSAASPTSARRDGGRLAALVGARRADVLCVLAEPRTTLAVAAAVGVAPSTASEHLTALARTGLLDRRRRGREVYYALNDRGCALMALFVDTG